MQNKWNGCSWLFDQGKADEWSSGLKTEITQLTSPYSIPDQGVVCPSYRGHVVEFDISNSAKSNLCQRNFDWVSERVYCCWRKSLRDLTHSNSRLHVSCVLAQAGVLYAMVSRTIMFRAGLFTGVLRLTFQASLVGVVHLAFLITAYALRFVSSIMIITPRALMHFRLTYH